MGKLVYVMNTSLDGYVEDSAGKFEWTTPDEEVFLAISDIVRAAGTYLYGRRMYETMVCWDSSAAFERATGQPLDGQPAPTRDFAKMWQAADKIVYSQTLERVATARTQLRSKFDTQEIGNLKSQTNRDITIGGPHLAAAAIRADLIDEYNLFVVPIVVGKGKSMFSNEVSMSLDFLDERHYKSGVVRLRYRRRERGKSGQ